MVRIDALLSARLFLAPHWVGDRIYFISNLGGHLSLYAMDAGGSVPEPLLPPHLALQNPELLGGEPFAVFPELGKILVMIDRDGDENYQPMLVPLDGGFPAPAFGGQLDGFRVHLGHVDHERGIAYMSAESRTESMNHGFAGDVAAGTLEELGRDPYGFEVSGVNKAGTKAAVLSLYTVGDHLLRLWTRGGGEPRVLIGKPLSERRPGEKVPLNSAGHCHFTDADKGLLFITSLFQDTYGLGYLSLEGTGAPEPRAVSVKGAVHTGAGEMTKLEQLRPGRFLVGYNIDGCNWIYEGSFDERALTMTLDRVVCGQGPLAGGVAGEWHYDEAGDRYTLSFSTAMSPTQIYKVEGADRAKVSTVTRERVLGVPLEHLAPGEDASFTSHDGKRVSARLYLPSPKLGYKGPRPVVYYVHGGPQSQERPNFAWFSMPLIQFLTLNGFSVFVPNARGSTGYGLDYTKQVDKDWGGQDRLDHVHAMTKILPRDERVDVSRAAVVGRSYGGYMTLTLAGRHPELWSAACDMFGPFDLFTFLERIPETWKPYFEIALGNTVVDKELLTERSPKTHLHRLGCPLLVIQGKNDPRVVERESRDLVDHLRATGKDVDYLMFENEGHDVLKMENRVRCYNAITDFFKKHLKP